MAGPWKYDPVAYFYIEALETYLKKPGREGVSLDLFDRLQALSVKNKDGDNSLETSRRRISWCCYVVGDMMLELLQTPLPAAPPASRPALTDKHLEAMKDAMIEIRMAAEVDGAEFVMGDPEAKRKAAQLWGDQTMKLKELVHHALQLIGAGREYLQDGSSDNASRVGEELIQFLLTMEKPRDDMVRIAESLVEIHA
jgi:hypothetical protein